ncbi:transglycosylase SLT domain-containing protein [Stutzerimonas azotifigens]|uniref:Transglycosylase SLT domain-containing protein n=1 Tax=Stutzerimonas azotifigens TaxID=291995 RepID=A0ABR5Z406_9GAMM|nr:transglycosylase SLT domain-containing protein [Stutzerimonas azotifigens]MBA1274861.1 transglycosylase SLT domain-containing protein [Stutzerimonas azotifigens]
MSIVSLPQHFNAQRVRGESPAAARRQQLEAVSEQFEALFLQQILKQMRKASDVLGAGNPMRSRELDTMRDFYDEVLAQTLAGKRQTGIADMLVQQLGGGADLVAAQAPASGTLPGRSQGASLHSIGRSVQRGVEALDMAWTRGKEGFRALVDSVIKHESSGNIAAVSAKGARGLMQLMPGTARDMAAELGLPYSEARLTEDAEYNKRLGSAYLNKMLDRYDGHQALALAAYNAGPGKVDEWLKTLGDPRTGEIGTAAWVQKIPYQETRNYTRNILGDLQAAAARPRAEQAQMTLDTTPRWSQQARVGLESAERLKNAELIAVSQGKRLVIDEADSDDAALKSAPDPVALFRNQHPVAAPGGHQSVAFAQPIRIEKEILS